ncbi:histidinol-phosphate transaminase [Trueperella pecoris]|uniref:histidinol-phosphate transaminase n=1 Tax=Trueperella pecoris TaxID=2733571 RepID=UPI001ABE57CD|nr:histidinol-phosphate transaminase [Trueperella pecoris]QTG75626.1 histidinol-phosphate transaminase [Trueperella pecoris]
MADFFRPDLKDLPAYVAGRNPDDPGVIKVASNEMPFPTLSGVSAALAGRLGDLGRYPDWGSAALKEAIAAFHQTSVANVAVGNGSSALIEKFLQAVCTPGGEVVFPWRSFEAYPIAIRVAGGVPVKVPLRDDGRLDLARMLDAITARTRAVLVCTPNNPTGAALHHGELHRFLRSVPREIPVLIDEAYVDFLEMDDPVRGVELSREFPNAISLRTFSKAYGLAGLRIGYAVGMEGVVAGLDKVATPFSVNTLAQTAATAALQQRGEVERRVGIIKAERAKLVSALRALEWDGPDPQGNFIWFGLGEESERFARRCESEKIIVRTFAGEGVRVTVAGPEASLRIVRAYRAFRS